MEFVKKVLTITNRPENVALAKEYINKERKLPCNPKSFGYVDMLPIDDTTYINKALMIFTRDITGEITQIVSRNIMIKHYDKLWTDRNAIPIYNMQNVIHHNTIIITESVIEAETINYTIKGVCAISVNSASVKRSQLYLIASIMKGKRLFIALNNDGAGIENAKRIKSFMMDNFMIPSHFIDYPFNDLNKFYTTKGKKFFTSHIIREIEG